MYVYPVRDGIDENNEYIKAKFKINDMVYFKSEAPLDALGNKQPTKNFRLVIGDIIYILEKLLKMYYCIILQLFTIENIPNVYYTKHTNNTFAWHWYSFT